MCDLLLVIFEVLLYPWGYTVANSYLLNIPTRVDPAVCMYVCMCSLCGLIVNFVQIHTCDPSSAQNLFTRH